MATQEDLENLEDEVTEVEPGAYVPWMYGWSRISHYYGDSVRQILLAAAALMLVGMPFYTDDLSVEMPFIVIAAVVLVIVAALTSPMKSAFISADVIVSGVGLIIFEIWAILGYGESTVLQFVLREALAILFLFALYFSSKTLRSMLLNQIGTRHSKKPTVQVRRDEPKTPFEKIATENENRKSLFEYNESVKHEYDD